MDTETILTFAAILAALLVWSAMVLWLDRKGVLKKFSMARIWAIGLMWRTERGKGTIERLSSPKKFWNIAATTGLALFYTGMLAMFVLLLISAYFSITSNLAKPVGADEIFVLPGINPYIPLVFGLIGLIVAVVVHELSHGIMARAMDFAVKSLGIIFILVPIGAFMEPDDAQVEKGPRHARMKMFASGPLMNFLFAMFFLGLFSWGFMGSVGAAGSPYIITNIYEQSPLHLSLDGTPIALYGANGTPVHSYDDLYSIEGISPGTWTFLDVRISDDSVKVPIVAGVMVVGISEGTPAHDEELRKGSIILSLDNTTVWNLRTFHELMDETKEGQTISLKVLEPKVDNDSGKILLSSPYPNWTGPNGTLYDGLKGFPSYSEKTFNLTLEDKYDYINMDRFKGKGYLGVSTAYLGISGIGSEEQIDTLSRPLASGEGFRGKFGNVMYIIFRLPLDTKVMPFHSPLTELYELEGPLSFLPPGAFWFLANTCFYIFWINILLGLFNALPMVPLDGGFVFRDSIVLILGKINRRAPEEKLVKWAKSISNWASLLVLSLILVSIIGPWLRVLFF